MITKESVNKEHFVKKCYFAKSARETFSFILQTLFVNTNQKILMPSYIGETKTEGSGVFDPVRNNHIGFDFYRLNKDLSVDLEYLDILLMSNEYKALLIIHYFGFIQNDMNIIRQKCDQYNVILIEDCAHTFFSKQKDIQVGEWGDFSIFSIHKILPTLDGGFFRIKGALCINWDIEAQAITKSTFDQFVRAEYDKINELKRNNYIHYLEHLKSRGLIEPLYSTLPDGVIPLNFPIVVKDGLREKLYFKLIDRGIITCSLYYNLIHEILLDKFPDSYLLSGKILNLPVHQDTTKEDIDYIIEQIQDIESELLIIS